MSTHSASRRRAAHWRSETVPKESGSQRSTPGRDLRRGPQNYSWSSSENLDCARAGITLESRQLTFAKAEEFENEGGRPAPAHTAYDFELIDLPSRCPQTLVHPCGRKQQRLEGDYYGAIPQIPRRISSSSFLAESCRSAPSIGSAHAASAHPRCFSLFKLQFRTHFQARQENAQTLLNF
jgi:hypothetical protein